MDAPASAGPGADPRTAIRRRDRRVDDDAWIAAVLAREEVGVLATASDGQPFLNGNLFVHDPDARAIYVHTARRGRTRSNAEANPRGCFHVFRLGRLLPADTALEFSAEYESVTVFGRLEPVDDRSEARRALELLLEKYAPHLRPGHDYRPVVDEELARTTVLRLAVEAWSGKRHAAPPDFPGAYRYPDPDPPDA